MPKHHKGSSAAHPCSSMEKLRSKLALLEAQADILDDWEAERQRAPCQTAHIKAARAPCVVADMISELKTYLEAVVDADRAADPLLLSITQQHCISYAVRVIDEVEQGTVPAGKVGISRPVGVGGGGARGSGKCKWVRA